GFVRTILVTIAARTMLSTVPRLTRSALSLATLSLPSFGFLIAFRLGQQNFTRQPELSGLLIDLDQLHLHGIAYIVHPVHGFQAAPVDLRNMEQTVLARHELNERAERHDRFHNTVVLLAHFRRGRDHPDPVCSQVKGLLVGSKDLHLAFFTHFLYVDGGTGFTLKLLDILAARTNYRANELPGNGNLHNTGRMRLVIFARSAQDFGHFIPDMQPSLPGLLQGFGQYLVGQPVHLDIHLAGGDAFV